ncbi:ThuA domain-containing protein [Solirubrobacter sp. CPCC 204708]|uniref:ThuA domain-containing protein n=1 Tax=Solirubrobacter deserti TaxID=2282478 RepID=A0ABT4RSX2_9ACTN|nr:ThuA domain-containing protein [Solirubrobacter deserti]MBE2320930.1 ThuA domain-containing protein [Solirubrobacter deserti]MDA0141674.1 ThuA domain-containing protein [Solirubrobacter deserti]
MGLPRPIAAAIAVIALSLCWTGAARAQVPAAGDFQKVTLDDNTSNPMELDVAPDGRVFYIERDGRLMIWKPNTRQTVTAGTVPVTTSQENGLLGLQLAPDFATSNWVYLFYSQLPDSSNTQVVSRLKVNGDSLDLGSEQRILTFTHQRGQCCHSSGSLYFGPDGSLYISTGDNTNPFDSNGYNPIDERTGRSAWDAQRTSANTNDLNGKILRIKPVDNPTGTPGLGNTYTVPPGNMFPASDKTRPEIFAMGFRNPFRFTVDPETSWVLSADYGPDASTANANRGPAGSVEFNVVASPGNYGWPYCIRDNTAYNDYNFATSTSGPQFDCANLKNESPNNTGLTDLPAARGATAWLSFSQTDPRFPGLGTGGAPMGGPRYHYDPNLVSDRKFPAYYDDKWFIGEWNQGWIKTADLNASGAMTGVQNFALGTGYKRPMDLDFGPDGALYVIEWGSGFNGNNADSGVYRVDYIAGDKSPIAKASASVTSGLAPLAVNFSAEGSSDPEGGPLTYAWDFTSDGTTDSTAISPSFTYASNGAYTAKLTVTDQTGLTAVQNIQISVGNRAPTVTIETPLDGQVASFTDKIPYKISITDPEDGSTGSGINCNDITVKLALGHDEHSHDLTSATGCEGVLASGLAAGHGPEANTFTVLTVAYTDRGGPGGIVPLTERAQAILQPKEKQAEFFSATGRVADGTTAGAAGVTTETTTDTAGGGLNIGFIEDGDYVSYKPVNLKDVTAMKFRVASAGAGGTIEVRSGSPTGTLIGTTETITPTGGWQTFKDVRLNLTNPPATTTELFLVFRNRGNTQNLFNLNWIEFVGKGGAQTASPELAITATPVSGVAPLAVKFDATATDADGGTLAYAWDFGVPGTSADTSTVEDPTYTYANPGTYTATLTVTDGQSGTVTKTLTVNVTAPSGCFPGYKDEFDGGDLGAGWEVVRRDQTLTVADGKLTIPAQAGDVYQTTNNAKNLVLRPAPAGAWTFTTKVNFKGLVQYQQAGILVYGDDDNYTKFDRVSTNAASATTPVEKFEFINEVAGTPRNASQDGTANLAANFPNDFFLRVKSDGTNITGEYSTDGTTWTAVGRSAVQPANAKIGVFALSNAATTVTNAQFDYVTLEGTNVPVPLVPGDEFDGTSLNKTRWNAIVREDDTKYSLANGALTITTVEGDINTTSNPANTRNFILQSPTNAGSDYVLETKLSGTITGGFSQGGLLIYTDDDNYVKLDAISDQNQTRINRIELRSEQGGATQSPQPQATGTAIPTGTANFWLRLTKTGTTYKGEYSLDGTTWVSSFATVSNTQTAPRFGLFTISGQAAGANKTVTFDYFKVNGSTGCGGGGPVNTAPVITTATASNTAGIAPLATTFNAAATDADGDTLSYAWDFDNNGTNDATGASASTTFATAGTKTVKLTVSDGKGGTTTRNLTVTVLAPDDATKKLRALVFSKTAAFRHDNIGAGITALQALATSKNWQLDASEDASLFTADILSHYDAVIFLSTTGDVLNASQQVAFENFIKSGKGYVGIHAASDTEYDWPWYGRLVGAYFRNHPAGTPTATVIKEDLTDPSTIGLEARWTRTDEWYNYKAPSNTSNDDYSPRATPGVHVLLTMDETTYAEDDGNTTDDDHPISWCQRYDGGRSWYTGMGHTSASFQEAGFLAHIGAGIEIAAGKLASAACGVAPANADPVIGTATGSVSSGAAPLAVTFAATATDADGDALTYAWDLDGNGTFETSGQNPSFTYTTAGSYTPVVKVTDARGASATKTLAAITVTNPTQSTNVPVDVTGNVPTVLSISLGNAISLGTFTPGVAQDYTTTVPATVTSTLPSATFSVRDPSSTAPGKLVNGTMALTQPVRFKAGDGAFGALSADPLTLAAYSSPVAARSVPVTVSQTITADEALLRGSYGKQVVFTLSSTTP